MSKTAPLIESSPEEGQQLLKQRFDDYGYLYFPRYVAERACRLMLQSFLDCLEPHVTFDQRNQRPILAGQPFFETDPIWDQVYPKMQSLQSFHEFFHQAELQQLMQILAGEQVFVYPMKMARIATPRKLGYETPPHQDAHSHQAGPSMAGIWVALHDVEEGMGRLQLLPGSHRRGVRKVFTAEGVGGVQCEIYPDEQLWHVSDIEQGGVILFHSCCVHRAEPNTSKESVRISIDTRFCDYAAPVFVSNLEPHHAWRIDGFDWTSIYRDWDKSDLQYYWKNYPNIISELWVYPESDSDYPLGEGKTAQLGEGKTAQSLN